MSSDVEEIWKPIRGYEGYYSVSNLGEVKSEERVVDNPANGGYIKEKILQSVTNKRGYLQVNLCKDKKAVTRKVHKLVSDTFLGPCPKGQECRHINSIKVDCRLSNLDYSTHKSNCKDKMGDGTHGVGTANGRCKLEPEYVKYILRMRGVKSQTVLAKELGVSRGYICKIQLSKSRNPDSLLQSLNAMREDTVKLHGGVWSKRRVAEYQALENEYAILRRDGFQVSR